MIVVEIYFSKFVSAKFKTEKKYLVSDYELTV